jgi:hypothetical protein
LTGSPPFVRTLAEHRSGLSEPDGGVGATVRMPVRLRPGHPAVEWHGIGLVDPKPRQPPTFTGTDLTGRGSGERGPQRLARAGRSGPPAGTGVPGSRAERGSPALRYGRDPVGPFGAWCLDD